MNDTLTTTAQEQAPVTTGIDVDLIAVRACSFEDHLFEATVIHGRPPEKEPIELVGIDLSAQVGIWLAKDARSAMVRLMIRVSPKHQPTWTASVEVVGQYSCGEAPVIPLERFARNNGIAYLVPYARERLGNMVSSSVFKAFILPPISVAHLLALSQASGIDDEPKELGTP